MVTVKAGGIGGGETKATNEIQRRDPIEKAGFKVKKQRITLLQVRKNGNEEREREKVEEKRARWMRAKEGGEL
jgi:hypothetical protein